MSTDTGHNGLHSGKYDRDMMLRALQLAANGAGYVSPNPMVGAVIVAEDGRIIGRGWHRKYGGPHAEVQAFRSVSPRDERLLPEATIYVTLEPCSHYGKTPAQMGRRRTGKYGPQKSRLYSRMRAAGISADTDFQSGRDGADARTARHGRCHHGRHQHIAQRQPVAHHTPVAREFTATRHIPVVTTTGFA